LEKSESEDEERRGGVQASEEEEGRVGEEEGRARARAERGKDSGGR